MAASSELHGVHQPVRSISLPTRLHPCSVRLESILNRLKSCQISSSSTTAPFKTESIQPSLAGLAEFFSCLEELIHSPLTQQALLRHENGKLVEEILGGSLTLLDTCDTSRNIVCTMKEHVQSLQSALRRKGVDSRIESDIHAYMRFRKNVKKDIAKCLKALKRMGNTVDSAPVLLHFDHHLSMVVRVLKEASAISLSIFRSLLLFLSVPRMKIDGRCSMTSRLKCLRLLPSEKEQKIINVVGCVDLALSSLHGHLIRHNDDAKADIQLAQRKLETLHLNIDDIEDGLDCIFRCLVRNRVSFLNILAH
ncbi:hypothetical protein I3842_Q089500 [Carya illinoinensis]|uniref:DUF241 domain protein n=1 Tax=Carya illinoinensis TaxID=32201 RepID=A0A922D089_CARIL|nr:hypothetical protein I3842_Q089500 [Carya illinoinensis]